ncbi:S8 family peptidase [Undibacterium sp. Ji83W]|uniref:S8 family peptidase n=1 Tax=Undibacterium sp. Ji83W TaxID=3413043 RepID=UPI003BF35153
MKPRWNINWTNSLSKFGLCLFLSLTAVSLTSPASADTVEYQEQSAVKEPEAKRRILVMLHLPAPHFRPDVSYSGGYSNDVSRTARRRIAEELAHAHGLKLLEDWPMPVLNVDCFVMEESDAISEEQTIASLSKDARVAWVQTINTFDAQAKSDPLFPVQPANKYWQLDEIRKIATGRNVVVAVIDSGVEIKHPDLAGQISLNQNFIDGNPYVGETHGTGVAGVIAARAGNGVGIEGIAPNTHVMALRACWQEPENKTRCNSFTLGKALNFALTQGVQVINMSLSGPPDRLLKQLLDAAISRNIKIVGAMDPNRADGGFPASHPGVFAVADSKTRLLANDILIAPGRDIPTTAPGARWSFVSGSSYSAAHISGMMALLSELKPSASLAQIRADLVVNPVNQSDANISGQVNLCATLNRLTNKCACSCQLAAPSAKAAATANQP